MMVRLKRATPFASIFQARSGQFQPALVVVVIAVPPVPSFVIAALVDGDVPRLPLPFEVAKAILVPEGAPFVVVVDGAKKFQNVALLDDGGFRFAFGDFESLNADRDERQED